MDVFLPVYFSSCIIVSFIILCCMDDRTTVKSILRPFKYGIFKNGIMVKHLFFLLVLPSLILMYTLTFLFICISSFVDVMKGRSKNEKVKRFFDKKITK